MRVVNDATVLQHTCVCVIVSFLLAFLSTGCSIYAMYMRVTCGGPPDLFSSLSPFNRSGRFSGIFQQLLIIIVINIIMGLLLHETSFRRFFFFCVLA